VSFRVFRGRKGDGMAKLKSRSATTENVSISASKSSLGLFSLLFRVLRGRKGDGMAIPKSRSATTENVSISTSKSSLALFSLLFSCFAGEKATEWRNESLGRRQLKTLASQQVNPVLLFFRVFSRVSLANLPNCLNTERSGESALRASARCFDR